MNHSVAYTQLMLLTLLALLGTGCTRGINESPIEFEERSTRNTENMTPEEWESFKNKAIELIIRRYNGQTKPTTGQVRVVDLNKSTASQEILISPKEEKNANAPSLDRLEVPETLTPSKLPAIKRPPVKSPDKTFEKVDRYSQLKIKPEETKGKQYKIPPNAIAKAQPTPQPKTEAQKPYIWPAKGTISRGYGKTDKGMNNGINIKVSNGSHVSAIENGKIIFVGTIKGMGKVILIEHPNQMIAAYAQVSNITVRTNDAVKKGQKIASIVSTDGKDGELHFELRKGTQSVDPAEYLPR